MRFLTLTLAAGLLGYLSWRRSVAAAGSRPNAASEAVSTQDRRAGTRHGPAFSIATCLAALALLGLARALYGWLDSVFFRLAAAGCLAFMSGRWLSANISRLDWPPTFARAAHTMTIGLLVAALGYLAFRDAWIWRSERAAIAARQQEQEAQQAAALAIENAKRPWQPGPGVAEAGGGPMLVWLAVPPSVPVQEEYEKRLEQNGRAERLIPLDVVVLNNSFHDAALDTAANGGRLWKAWVTRDNSAGSFTEWTADWPEGKAVFYPARRADFAIDWDGRDRSGQLVPAGDYTVHLETAPILPDGNSARLQAVCRIYEAGAVVVESPATAFPKQILQDQQLFEQMRRNTEMLQRLQFDSLRRY